MILEASTISELSVEQACQILTWARATSAHTQRAGRRSAGRRSGTGRLAPPILCSCPGALCNGSPFPVVGIGAAPADLPQPADVQARPVDQRQPLRSANECPPGWLSMQVTVSPRATRRRTRRYPMKPVPPMTNTVICFSRTSGAVAPFCYPFEAHHREKMLHRTARTLANAALGHLAPSREDHSHGRSTFDSRLGCCSSERLGHPIKREACQH
jgi:hypothetical protein